MLHCCMRDCLSTASTTGMLLPNCMEICVTANLLPNGTRVGENGKECVETCDRALEELSEIALSGDCTSSCVDATLALLPSTGKANAAALCA